jgi:small subunit ribosomal protein S16
MVTIRLQRHGRKNHPFYRVVAMDHLKRREGPVLENLGIYDPVNPKADQQVRLNDDRIKHWLGRGASPSDTVRDLLAKRGLVDVKLWEKDREHDRKRLQARLAKAAAAGENKDEKKEEKKEEKKG